MTLPTDHNARKRIPLYSGCLTYFPDALAGVAKLSLSGNDKHNQGKPLHHDRNKSSDHADCILRHLSDLAAAISYWEFVGYGSHGEELQTGAVRDMCIQDILNEANAVAWRALALSQILHEKYEDHPMAPAARSST